MGREHCSGLCAQFGRHFRLGFQHIQARSGKMPLRSASMTAAVSTTPTTAHVDDDPARACQRELLAIDEVVRTLGERGVNDHDIALAEELRQSDELQVPSAPAREDAADHERSNLLGLLDWYFGRLCTFKDFVDVEGRAVEARIQIDAVADETARFDVLAAKLPVLGSRPI
jgi:hypothetical protein